VVKLDTLLLLALPASGKSEIRRYLENVDPAAALCDFGLGPTVQLDDYPYVQLMQLLNRELVIAGGPPLFFNPSDGLLIEPRDWAALARMLSQDYAHPGAPPPEPSHPTADLLNRFDEARSAIGSKPVTTLIDTAMSLALARALDHEVASFSQSLAAGLRRHTRGSTVMVEFARGAPKVRNCRFCLRMDTRSHCPTLAMTC
jgi:hypothetical protein